MIEAFFTRKELYSLLYKKPIGAEIGVARGDNSLLLYHTAKPDKMYLVDRWSNSQPPIAFLGMNNNHIINKRDRKKIDNYYSEVKKTFSAEIEKNKIQVIRSDSIRWLKSIPDNYLDWIYVDTSHMYEETIIELRLATSKVKNGGLICGHDFCTSPLWGHGVIAPVIELIQENKIKMIGLSTESLPSFACLNLCD